MANNGKGKRKPKKYPEGQRDQVTPEWKVELRAWLDSRGWTQDRLAKELGVHKTSITNLFRDETGSSKTVRGICALTGLAMPTPNLTDKAKEWLALGSELDELAPDDFTEWLKDIRDQVRILRRKRDRRGLKDGD